MYEVFVSPNAFASLINTFWGISDPYIFVTLLYVNDIGLIVYLLVHVSIISVALCSVPYNELYRAVRALVEQNLNITNAIDFGEI